MLYYTTIYRNVWEGMGCPENNSGQGLLKALKLVTTKPKRLNPAHKVRDKML